VLDQGDVDMLWTSTKDFEKDRANSGAIFLNKGQPFQPGERLVQKDLARTLRLISAKGTDGFYKGEVASKLVASMKAGGGIITQADLDQYKTRELAPVECDYRGYHVVSAPPPSSGGVVICEIMNILEGYPMKELGFHSAQGVHYTIEAMRHAYVDRNSYLGDPDFVKNPLAHLLDKDYAAKIRAAINPQKAGISQEIKPGVRKGGTGVLLNDEMDDFTAKVGVPNMYGLIQGEANAIGPGRRPLSSMSPTIVTKDGKTVMVVGTPGGSRIITATLLTMLNMIDYGMNLQEAVDAPRFHQQWMPEATNIEAFALSPDTQKILESWGQKFAGPQPANHVAAILVGAPSLGGKPIGKNRFYGANDPRRNTGLALGY
jgi:gamma-glutamyltranspeptidase/glutathione hydrolase